jgi:hypothetical protein
MDGSGAARRRSTGALSRGAESWPSGGIRRRDPPSTTNRTSQRSAGHSNLAASIKDVREPVVAGTKLRPPGFSSEQSAMVIPMPYTRPYRRFYLTPPTVPTFVISALLAFVAVLAVYGHSTLLHGVSAFVLLLIAYVVLVLGNLLRGV